MSGFAWGLFLGLAAFLVALAVLVVWPSVALIKTTRPTDLDYARGLASLPWPAFVFSTWVNYLIHQAQAVTPPSLRVIEIAFGFVQCQVNATLNCQDDAAGMVAAKCLLSNCISGAAPTGINTPAYPRCHRVLDQA